GTSAYVGLLGAAGWKKRGGDFSIGVSWGERGCHPERRRREGSLLGRRQWERDGDPSARPWSGADVDSGVVRVHDPARDREAEARAVRLAPRRLTAIEIGRAHV